MKDEFGTSKYLKGVTEARKVRAAVAVGPFGVLLAV